MEAEGAVVGVNADDKDRVERLEGVAVDEKSTAEPGLEGDSCRFVSCHVGGDVAARCFEDALDGA